jgi:hypothetical protein
VSRPRGYVARWHPQRKTLVLLNHVDEVLELYADFLPLTVRQILYRLVSSHGYSKGEYDRLGNCLVTARRARRIAFSAIRDDGVGWAQHEMYADTDAFWDDHGRRISEYRRDRQNGQAQRVELWCEAVGMIPQLARVASDYSVPVYSSGGVVSVTGTHNIAMRAVGRSVPTVLLQVGDHDLSGVIIFNAMAEDAAAFVEADRVTANVSLRAVRVAVTPEQIALYGLETNPASARDVREGWVGRTCQVEALAPDQLARIVRAAIERELDVDRLQREIEREVADRADLLGLPPGSAS